MSKAKQYSPDLLPDFRSIANLVESVSNEEQILDFLKQAEAGVPVKELCRQHGFSDASFYTWRSKYAGMTVPDARRLRDLRWQGISCNG